jgi:hypothetical protein
MDETEPKGPAYSGEQTKVTGPDSLRSTTAAAKTSEPEKTATASKQTQTAQKVAAPEITRTGGTASGADFVEFLKRTKGVWLGIAGGILGVMTLVTVVTRMSERARDAREKRQEQVVLDVMPEKLISRCGPPSEDVSKEMYPVVLRTMTYQRGESEKIVFEFSRTAEAKSDWVFLSMKDQSGARNFETTEAKIAALPCLDSKK